MKDVFCFGYQVNWKVKVRLGAKAEHSASSLKGKSHLGIYLAISAGTDQLFPSSCGESAAEQSPAHTRALQAPAGAGECDLENFLGAAAGL